MSKLIARVKKKAGPIQSKVWSQYLQSQIMHLLLRHNQQLFQGQFRVFFAQSTLPKIPLLQFYDRYIRLQISGNELLNEILPDIERQLDLRNDFELLLEDTPTRGDIDWQRTITRAINESPDQPPHRFETRVLQQSTATPENLLIVTILLSYQQVVQDVLRTDNQQEVLNEQERLVLLEMEESVAHKLNKPYTRDLLEEADSIDIEAFVEQIALHLKPGANPYRNLITWWENFRDLHIGKTLVQHHLTLAHTRNDEQVENWLYELWIALEILDLLNGTRMIVPGTIEIESDRLQCLFTWGDRRFRFRYQRYAALTTDEVLGWQDSDELVCTYTIERERPLKVAPAGTIIWQESPVLFAASYSSESRESTSNQEVIQQLLGGMQLSGARRGGLFSPMLPDPSEGRQWSSVIQSDAKMYVERAETHTGVRLYKITPDVTRETLRLRLQAALQEAVEMLPERLIPACYGVLLDTDTVNASRKSIHSGNVLCPKPHIGADVFDLVDNKLHCLKDPRLCHVYGQPIAPPFVIRVDTLGGLEKQNSDLRALTEERLLETENADDEVGTEQLRSHIFLGIGRAIERYVQLHGNTTAIEAHFEEWIFGDHWKKHLRCLSEETRNNLLSGEYVWGEYKRTKGLSDWAAPAIQYCRALENEIHRRIHNYYPDAHARYADVGQKGFSGHMTLGFLETIYGYRGQSVRSGMPQKEIQKIRSAQHNWPLCEAIARRAACNISDFEQILQRIITERVTPRRNKLAHGDAVLQSDAKALRDAIIGQKGSPGILIWLAENLEPKR